MTLVVSPSIITLRERGHEAAASPEACDTLLAQRLRTAASWVARENQDKASLVQTRGQEKPLNDLDGHSFES